MQHAASAITAPDTGQLPVYWQFHEAVTRAQLTEWLPTGRHLLVDVSGPRGPGRRTGRQGRSHGAALSLGRGGLGAGGSPQDRGVPGGSGSSPRASTAANRAGDRGLVAADLPGRRLRGRGHRGRPGAVGVPGRRGDDRRDRPGAAPGGPGDRLRRLAGARHGRAGRPAPLGAPGRPAARRGGAGALAGRQDHPVLRPGPGPRAVHRGRAAGQLDPAADRVLRVGGDALAAARPSRAAQAGAGRTRGPARRVARRAAGDLGQQARAGQGPRGLGKGFPPERGIPGSPPGASTDLRLAHLAWQPTQRAASGRASSLPSGISWPQSTHRP